MSATWNEAFAAIAEKVKAAAPEKVGAIAGDLCAVEDMFALQALMASLGSHNLDCRQDGAKHDPAMGRASYLFNATVEGIEAADAILVVGSNPRRESPVLNARIRKRWLKGSFSIGVIGEQADLTYPYTYLGAGPETLGELPKAFAESFAKAERPLVIVGQGALARADGTAVLATAAKLAGGGDAWRGLSVLHTAASRVGALDLGFVPGDGGLDAAAMAAPGALDVVFLLGADEIAVGTGAFTIYIGTHGDRGAARADVVLPGACYTEKSGLYVNTEGRVQLADRANFPPGDAREDWAILRALSAVIGTPLPFDSLAALRAKLYAAHPHMARLGEIAEGPPLRLEAAAGRARPRAVRLADCRLLLDQPDRAGLESDAGGLGAGAGRDAAGGGVGPMDFLALFLTLLKTVVTLVVLLVSIAYILLADRKIWAAVQMRRGPERRRPLGPFPELRRPHQVRAQGAGDPGRRQQGRLPARALRHGSARFVGLGNHPVAHGWAVADINVGTLYIFAISSLSVYGVIMGGWASNSKYPFLSALRSAAQMVSYEVSIGFVIVTVLLCAGSLNLTKIVEAQDTHWGILGWYWLPLFPMFVIFFVSALAETNRPPFDLVEAESELVAGFMVEYSSSPYMLFMLAEYVAMMTMAALQVILFMGGWLSPIPFPPFTWVPGVIWFLIKILLVFFMFSMVKAFVPRYRYDQLMRLGWKVFLPLSLAFVVLVAAVLEFTGWGGVMAQ